MAVMHNPGSKEGKKGLGKTTQGGGLIYRSFLCLFTPVVSLPLSQE